jgi:hypothetical protein
MNYRAWPRKFLIIKEVKHEYMTFPILHQYVAANEWFWLSGSDAGQTKGQFYWLDGTKVDACACMWKEEFPKNFNEGRDTSVYFHTYEGKLLDSDSLNGAAFVICDVPESLISCF